MARLAYLFFALALGACAHPDQDPESPGTTNPRADPGNRGPGQSARSTEVPYAYRPGPGTVESVTRVEHGGAAAAGGTAGRIVGGVAYRLGVRMDDGTLQTVLQDEAGWRVGDRVRLTEDGKVVRL